ncbi:methionine/alanine import family NSS transporter small subunit [Pseudoglutamicibacter albus]|nr:methionine/alanine import family NSS transporter small subunit [Pseudoglutamicibacter albus]WIK83830.1 methionine/alanine import family NSS transporter small subunit [Pseudoglutamicibacter albus]
MTPAAIGFLVLSIVTVWGGLTAAIVNLVIRPDEAKEDDL